MTISAIRSAGRRDQPVAGKDVVGQREHAKHRVDLVHTAHRELVNPRQSSAVYGAASEMFQQIEMISDFDSARHMAEALELASDSRP